MRAILTAILALVASVMFATPAYAGDVAAGERVFTNNCATCHAGGSNAVISSQTLKQEALEQYLFNYGTEHNVDAIAYQVANGRGAMPSFQGRISDKAIADVAAYVKAQSESGWQE
ncbi:cytochrome c6 [Leptolyngbya sp. Heron Island J]|uniref:c-type cytochrome n=1 Tax=Leptolyngbya sp. Heron Island J TaxID=1385935 RepID=UPI0003B94427|nr:c-type cytochrome [Leptolyngbya sp. Heron Island J]ESA33512.1 cytochrome c6 [Leptolyngbya sp. Heron Island J]